MEDLLRKVTGTWLESDNQVTKLLFECHNIVTQQPLNCHAAVG
jgi:hypothetical protein